ncbi:MAG: transposase [Bacillota bacterium]
MKKDTLSPVTFKQKAFKMLPDNWAKLKLPRTYDRREIVLKYRLPSDTVLGKVQQVKLVYEHQTGDWYLHVTLITDGFSFTVPGGEFLAIDRYFQKEKPKCTKSTSKKYVELTVKWGRQRNHYLHVLTKWLINLAIAHNVSTIAVGELKGIRADKDWGDASNQKLHAWPFSKIVNLLTYKAALAGIRVVKVSERSTSTTCPVCGKRVKIARVERGLFLHCKMAFNADMVGAYNILQRYLRETSLALPGWPGVVGALARPAVNLFVWRKTTPLGREQGTFRQAA